jgi:hypothetical protein
MLSEYQAGHEYGRSDAASGRALAACMPSNPSSDEFMAGWITGWNSSVELSRQIWWAV